MLSKSVARFSFIVCQYFQLYFRYSHVGVAKIMTSIMILTTTDCGIFVLLLFNNLQHLRLQIMHSVTAKARHMFKIL